MSPFVQRNPPVAKTAHCGSAHSASNAGNPAREFCAKWGILALERAAGGARSIFEMEGQFPQSSIPLDSIVYRFLPGMAT